MEKERSEKDQPAKKQKLRSADKPEDKAKDKAKDKSKDKSRPADNSLKKPQVKEKAALIDV